MMNAKRSGSLMAALISAALPLCAAADGERAGVARLPSAYPAAWNVIFGQAKPLPPGYDFGRRTTILTKGSVFPPAAMPLPCDIVWDRDIPVTLRDGVVIYTDVLRPVQQMVNLPAIVSWSPYGKTIPTPPAASVPPAFFSGLAKFEGADAAVFACNGYAVVNPDARGAFKSGGDIHFWGSVEAGDGHDVIEWAARQDWSNRKVALYGASWLAISQWFIAATKPPHLAAIVPWNGFSDVYRDHILWGGIPDVAFGMGAQANFTGEHGAEHAVDMALRDQLRNAYWEDKTADFEDITVPAYVVADGVTALHAAGTLEAFRRIASRDKWLRINNTNEWYDQANPVNQKDLLRFLDRYLKGVRNGWEQTPRVRVSVIDAGGVDKENVPYSNWPIPGTRYKKLYLDAVDGSLSPKRVRWSSVARYDAKAGETTFTLTFNEDTQLTGYLKARLWVEADGNDDMDVFVLAEKLDANGTVLVPHPDFAAAYFPLVPPPGSPGRLRASLRELDPRLSTHYIPVQKFRHAQKLRTGEIVPIDIALQPRAYLFHAGQKLRLTIAGHSIKYTTAGSSVPTLNQGTHVLHTGARYPSYLQVPVIAGRDRDEDERDDD